MKYFRVTARGHVLKVQFDEANSYRPIVAHVRGYVTEFSAKSRKRLIELFASLDKMRLSSAANRVKFITLTYADNMIDSERAKADLKRFVERCKYANHEFWCVWRMELQQRGAIHFHLICGNMAFTPKEDIQKMWSECAAQPVNVFTRIEAVRSFNGVMSYASKYMCKLQSHTGENAEGDVLVLTMCHTFGNENLSFGRFWGVWGRKYIPFAETMSAAVCLPENIFNWWLSICDNPHCNVDQSFTLFQDNAMALYRACCALFNCDRGLWGVLDAWQWVQGVRASQMTRDVMNALSLKAMLRRETALLMLGV